MPPSVPPYALTAVEALAQFRSGALTPSALLDSCLARTKATNGAINAYVCIDDESKLRAQAKEMDDQLAAAIKEGKTDSLPVLFGLPTGIKDLVETKGLKTTFGSLLFAEYVPTEDSDIVKRLRDAGAIIMGKVNTPEFGAGANTRNLVYGASGNPFDTKLSTAGSSGGSAAALAANMSPLALGSDMGGSLRTPAAFCSVIGFRPTPGLIPDMHKRTLPHSPLPVDGPMARTVADCSLFMSVLAVEEPRDPLSWSGIKGSDFLPQNLPKVDLKKLKVGFSEDLGGNIAIDDIVRDTFRSNVSKLTALFGAGSANIDDRLKDIFSLSKIPQTSAAVQSYHDVFSVLRAEHFLANLPGRKPENKDKLAFPVASNVNIAESYTYEDRMVAHAHSGILFRKWTELMGEFDLVILPTASAAPYDKMAMWAPEVVGGKKMANYFEWICITYFITLTQSPVLALPLGAYNAPLSHLPFGIQVVGRRRQDVHLFGVGLAMEQALQGRMEPSL